MSTRIALLTLAVFLALPVSRSSGADAPKAPPKIVPKKAAAAGEAERKLPPWQILTAKDAKVDKAVKTDKDKGKEGKDAKDAGKDAKEKGKDAKEKGKEVVQATLFDDFPATAQHKMKKPIAVYFYMPVEPKLDMTGKACAAFEKGIADAKELKKALEGIACYKCDAKALDKQLKTRYAATVPSLVFFDASGKRAQAVLKTFPKNEKEILKKIQDLKVASGKLTAKDDAAKKGEAPKKDASR